MFTDPRHNIYHAGIYDGMHIGDFGAGSGVYTLEVLPFVREEGMVCAIDIQKGLLERLKGLLSEKDVKCVKMLHGDLEEPNGSKLSNGCLDFGIASNILFQVRRKKNLLEEVHRTLRPKGKLLLVDWKDSFGFLGPHPKYVLHQNDARLLAELAGFRYVKAIPSGKYHYGMILEKT